MKLATKEDAELRPPTRRVYGQAAVAYAGLGLAVVAVTVASPGLAVAERRADLVHLLVGLPFIAVFALAIAFADRPVAIVLRGFGAAPARAGAWGAGLREKLVMLLSISALGRTLVFGANAVGLRPRLQLSLPLLSLETATPRPMMWLNAAMMAAICAFLVRASWWPWLRRSRRGGDVGRIEKAHEVPRAR